MNLRQFPEQMHRALKVEAAKSGSFLNVIVMNLAKNDPNILRTYEEIIKNDKKTN